MSIRRYVEKLTRGSGVRAHMSVRVPEARVSHADDSFETLHAALGGQKAIERSDPARASLLARLALALGGIAPQQGPTSAAAGAHRLTTPPFNRTPMAPRRWCRKERDTVPARPQARPRAWIGLRRITLLCLIVAQTALATHFMAEVLPYSGRQPLEVAILALFAILFGWISAGFWTAMAGFVLLARGRDRCAITRTAARDAPIDPGARTAIVMPICNEDVARVYAGLRATYESVEREGALEHFDFFVLSDTADPDTRVAETAAWKDLCRAVGGFGRIYYRWRQHRIKRKSGNVADFCRRWGRNYRYMVVLDADSVMSGACLTQLVRIMEANPDAGIVQTAPRAVGRETLYARIQQFAAGVYGPIFTAGLNFWQLGESHYWGHNAIIRVAPFIRHCALARLPGNGSLSGEILSHDFVEAALMRRAGWGVWLAYDLPGSYEEMPPNLVNELARDRRWCHGNLMNFRLFLMRGLHPAHRAVFVIGVMAYLSAPLWFLALILSTVLLGVHTLTEPQYFVEPYQLFPVWPSWRPEWAVALFGTTAVLLFLPKILSVLLIAARGAATHGGLLRLGVSLFSEMVVSALLAPIRMLFHTQYVAAALSGLRIKWKSPPREDTETTWREALSRHGWHTLLGLAWAALVYSLDPSFLWWLMPVAGAMMLSIPISVYTSRIGLGRRLRDSGYFAIPEELEPPPEMTATRRYTRAAPALPGFVDAVADPVVNALVCASAAARPGVTREVRIARLRLVHDALVEGPAALSALQKARLLNDSVALSQLHFQVWTYPDAHPDWHRATGMDAAEDNVVPLPRRRIEPRRVYVKPFAAAEALEASRVRRDSLPVTRGEFA